VALLDPGKDREGSAPLSTVSEMHLKKERHAYLLTRADKGGERSYFNSPGSGFLAGGPEK